MDESQPLLPSVSWDERARRLSRTVTKDTVIVDFSSTDDPDNPIEWREAYKWSIVALLAFMAFTVTFTCISVVPVASLIVRDLDKNHQSNKEASVLLVTIWELGEAAGPLLIGPLSEIFGRYRVLNAANGLFIATVIFAACCQSTHLFIAARCLTGVFVSSNVLNPAIVGDIYMPDQRGSAMSLIMLAPLVGGALGPAMAGVIAESLGWRQILWIAAALAIACEIALLFCFRETYKPAILHRRATRIRRKSIDPNADIRTTFEIERDEQLSTVESPWVSITRPFFIFYDSVVLQAMCLYAGLSFTYFYIVSTTLPDILQSNYSLSLAYTGLSLIPFSLGASVMVLICNRAIDGIYVKLRKSHKGVEEPEYRLPLVIVGSIALPLAMVFYGWAVQKHFPIAVFLCGVAFMGAALMLTFLPVTSYVVDALGLYSASGMTAIIVTRCLMSTFFPLTTMPLVNKFGYGWGFTIIGGILLCLAPIPMLIFKYGPRWRLRSEYTKGD